MAPLPIVSVIVPTYNRAALLREALQSVRVQTYERFEVIVVDDGSTDDTRDVVDSFDERFLYVYQENRGRSSARNNGLGRARGEYIAFLDSDDLLLPHKLEVQVRVLRDHPEVGWVYSSARNIDERGRPVGTCYWASTSGWIYEEIAFFRPLTVILPTVMVRRDVMDAVGGFDERMNRFEDTDMWRRISRKYEAFAVPEPLVEVRAHAGNTMEDPRLVFQSVSYYADKVFREDSGADLGLLRDRASEFFLHYGMAVWNLKGPSHARPFFRAAIRYGNREPQVIKWLISGYVGTWVVGPLEHGARAYRRVRESAGAFWRGPGGR